jgi:16S rRNA (uracil1498-N3)-methyltransferase
MAHEYRVFAEFDSSEIGPGSIGTLSESDRHHLNKVLRLREGDQIVAVSRKEAREFDAQIILHNNQIAVSVSAPRIGVAPLSRVVSLSCALLKGSNNDFICEHAAELGVRNILFFQAERSIPKIKEPSDRANKIARWSKIAESAARQSGQISIPAIGLAPDLSKLMSQTKLLAGKDDRFFCCALLPGTKEIRAIETPKAGVHLIVGPEGDFSESEYASLISNSFEAITLSPLRLRAETAAIAAVSMVQAVWGF